MDEETFDSWRHWRPFRHHEDVKDAERILVLAAQLWGDAEHLKRQVLVPSPEIPSGIGLPELHRLEQYAQLLLLLAHRSPKVPGFRPDAVITVGTRQVNLLEARYEVVQRAIKFLGGREN